jgi:hypothetical protein
MEAMPETYEAKKVHPTGHYKCPLCDVQTTADEVDTGWVFCPMLDGEPICLGCCLDYQNVARLEDFTTNPYNDLFDEASHKTGNPADRLRRICLDHQEEILVARIGKEHEQEDIRRGLANLLSVVRLRKEEL